MNSSINPSSESSNSPTPDHEQTGKQAAPAETLPLDPAATATDKAFLHRQQPIPPPSEPMQYRAIGLVRGRYQASAEQFTQGTLVASDGAELNAVLLGRIMSLVKNHLDLEQDHLWVVYPRTGQQDGNLHLQIVGVWEPEKLSKNPVATANTLPEEATGVTDVVVDLTDVSDLPNNSSTTSVTEADSSATQPLPGASAEIEDGYFSVRGEVVYQAAADGNIVVKIKQAPRKEADKPKYFKLKLNGTLGTKAVGQFWDFQAKREADALVLQHAEAIAKLPSKPKPRRKPQRPGSYSGPKRNLETPRPTRKGGESTSVKRPTVNRPPTPKPIKRQNPPPQ